LKPYLHIFEILKFASFMSPSSTLFGTCVSEVGYLIPHYTSIYSKRLLLYHAELIWFSMRGLGGGFMSFKADSISENVFGFMSWRRR